MANPLSDFWKNLKMRWNAFRDRNLEQEIKTDHGAASSRPTHRPALHGGVDRSIASPLYNRMSIDVSSIIFRHVRVDENEKFVETIASGLNNCLTLSANLDQSYRAFMQDAVMSMFDEGCVALVPVDTDVPLRNSGAFDVLSMRTGRIVQWYPQDVRISIYNDMTGLREELTLPKNKVAIVENPLYAVMNDRSSVLQRLIRKLNLLDTIDEQMGSGKLDLIIQLPYALKSDSRKIEAEQRRQLMEDQLNNSKHGVAYADATEKVIQLNRPVENNIMAQVEYLTSMLYSQLGLSEAIFNGTASEAEYLNYYNSTIEPICSAFAIEMKRKFLSSTAITQKQSIMFFRNMFALVTATTLAELADKFTRNEIASPNDIRSVVGWTPSKQAGANELRNRNLNQSTDPQPAPVPEPATVSGAQS